MTATNSTLPNHFLRGLRATPERCQYGLWCSLTSAVTTEICAGSGFDWLLFDMEHSPSDIGEVFGQLQAASAYPVSCIVRPPSNDVVAIKRLLDIGAQTLLIPFVQSAEEARAAVAATRYPPHGIRGLTMSSRANRFGRNPNYLKDGPNEIGVMVQVETRQGLEQLEAIAAVPGLAAVFIGPSDLSADMGHLGNAGAPEVRAAIVEAGGRLRAMNMPWGILVASEADAEFYAAQGAAFVGTGSDQNLLRKASDALAARFIASR